MKPISISERMMFNTVRLVASDRSSGTGYEHFDVSGTEIAVLRYTK